MRDSQDQQQMKPFMAVYDFMLISTDKIQHAKGKGSRMYKLCVILLGGYCVHISSKWFAFRLTNVYNADFFYLFHMMNISIEERLLNINSFSSMNCYIQHN